MADRPIALITGASRSRGIAAAVVAALAAEGWDIATTYWRACDAEQRHGGASTEAEEVLAVARQQLNTELRELTPPGRLGTTLDTARIVRFLCSEEGGWTNRQLIKSNGAID